MRRAEKGFSLVTGYSNFIVGCVMVNILSALAMVSKPKKVSVSVLMTNGQVNSGDIPSRPSTKGQKAKANILSLPILEFGLVLKQRT